MGCFNWFFKIIGIILMIFVVLLLPLTIFAGEVGDLFFSSDNVFSVIDEELLNPEFIEEALGEILVLAQTGGESGEEDAMREAIMSGIKEIPIETLNQVIATMLPVDLLSDLFGEISDGFYIWLNSEGYQSSIEIDLKPLKESITENVTPAMLLIFESLPECSAEDLAGGGWDKTCKPPEEYNEQVFEILDEPIQEQVNAIPDEIFLDEYLYEQGNDMITMRDTLRLVRDVLDFVWVLVIGLLLLGIILGARSIQGFFSWAGWPLLVTSLFILLIGIVLNISSLGIINFGLGKVNVEVPTFLIAPAYSIIDSIIGNIGTGMIWKGLIIFAVGLAAIIIGYVITVYRKRSQQIPISSPVEELISDIGSIEEETGQADLE